MSHTVEELEKYIDELYKRISDLETRNYEMTQRLNTLMGQFALIQGQRPWLDTTQSYIKKERTTHLEKKLSEKNEMIRQLEHELNAVRTSYKALNSQWEKQQQKLITIEDKVDKSIAQLELCERDRLMAHARAQDLQNEVFRLREYMKANGVVSEICVGNVRY